MGAPQVIFSVARCATSLMIDSSAPGKVQRLRQNTGEYDLGYFQRHGVSLLTNANNSGANNLRLPESLLHLLFRVSYLVKRMVAQDPCTHVWINGRFHSLSARPLRCPAPSPHHDGLFTLHHRQVTKLRCGVWAVHAHAWLPSGRLRCRTKHLPVVDFAWPIIVCTCQPPLTALITASRNQAAQSAP